MNKDNSKTNIKILLIFILLTLVTVTLILFVIPSVYENDCKTRVYEDLESRIDQSVLSANICIVKNKMVIHGNVAELSYSAGASGVIFDKKQGRYYALTAYHVVEDMDSNTTFIVQPYGAAPYSRKTEDGGHMSLEEYYSDFPVAKIEYWDEKKDLAVISFYFTQNLGALPIAEKNAVKNERIAVISNPDGQRFIHSFGSVVSDDPIIFSADNSKSTNMAIQHNAYTHHGSSGSAVLNENMEIVGINIGGGTDFMGRYKYSAMVSCQNIKRFLSEHR